MKAHYEQLLRDVETENERLESAIQAAQSGNVEESVKIQLSRIGTLEKQLQSLKEERQALIAESAPLKENIAKLNKKIKGLEEEVEEAEEEQEMLEKKLKSKTRELSDLNDELDKSKHINKKQEEDLKKKEDELERNIALLKLKSGSIEFVQEILSAHPTTALDVKALYKAIDFFESFLHGQFMDCNAYIYNTYTSLSFNNISGSAGFVEKKKMFTQLFEEWASVKRKSWLDGKTTIAFVGEFSAGKTSIVNRILSQDNPKIPLLPVSTKATTAIPTYIAGGVAETYNFVTPDDKLKSINEQIFKKVSKEVLDEIKGVSSLIKYFVMTYKNSNLNGLSILDTPGFNSNDDEDKRRTVEVINECDVLFWVVDVNSGTVNRSSIARIKDDLRKPIIVVINKIDTKSKSDVDKVEALIRNTFREEGVDIQDVIRFSAKAPLSDIMNPIKRVKRDTERESFINIVREDLNHLSSIFDDGVKNAAQEYNSKNEETNIITEKYNNAMNALWNACNEAAGIPHWEEHFFGSDRYEMTKKEGNRLMNLLEEIATTKASNLASIYNEEMNAVAEAQQAYSNLCDLKAAWQKIEDCISEFKKVSKSLENAKK